MSRSEMTFPYKYALDLANDCLKDIAPFCEQALSGSPLGMNSVEIGLRWVDEQNQPHALITRAEYAALIAWMQTNQFVAPDNGTKLSDAGREYMMEWLSTSPTGINLEDKDVSA